MPLDILHILLNLVENMAMNLHFLRFSLKQSTVVDTYVFCLGLRPLIGIIFNDSWHAVGIIKAHPSKIDKLISIPVLHFPVFCYLLPTLPLVKLSPDTAGIKKKN